VIAHRLSTIQRAERIIVLTENGIEDQGTHDELIPKNGAYTALCNVQLTFMSAAAPGASGRCSRFDSIS
jgi:ATP-binding cassette subfamily B protein